MSTPINPVLIITYMLKIQKKIHLHHSEVNVYEIDVTFCDLGLIFITLTLVWYAGYLKYLIKKRLGMKLLGGKMAENKEVCGYKRSSKSRKVPRAVCPETIVSAVY